MEEFYERVRFCVDRVGGQSEMARRVTAFTGRECKPQTIQYLCKEPKEGKPARASSLTPAIAAAANVNITWLATGQGARDEGPSEPPKTHESTGTSTNRSYPKELAPIFDAITDAWKSSSLPESLLHSFETLFRSLPTGAAQEQITDGSKADEHAAKETVSKLSKRIKPPKSQPVQDKTEQDDKN
jgi:hypothetical protein